MRFRVREILLVSSQYNLFLLEEDGRIYQFLRQEYFQLNLSHSPEIVRVSSGKEALDLLSEENRIDLVITTTHSGDIAVNDFARKVKETNQNLPVVHLVFDTSEFNPRLTSSTPKPFDRIFTWNGDFRIIIAIIKLIEDQQNVIRDVKLAGVQIILLVEDNIRFYSSYLPILYSELLSQSQTLIEQGINLYHKFLRMRARPKILLATNFEEACQYFDDYEEYILGVVSDVNYMRNDQRDEHAGIHLTRYIKEKKADIPILLQSHDLANQNKAYKAGASFLHKDSRYLLQEIQNFTIENLGFGDFIFKTEKEQEVGRATDLNSLKEMLKTIPDESLKYHSDRNHFSNWLKARREFWLAFKLRPRKLSDYDSVDDLRNLLVSSLDLYTSMQQRGVLTDFNKDTFDLEFGFSRIGSGSIGGKARGLSFLNQLVNNHDLHMKFDNVIIKIPSALVLGTHVFESFMNKNKLFKTVMDMQDDETILQTFLDAEFPNEISEQLFEYLEIVKQPIAIRSSSLLEDSQYFPFAGVYNTVMFANNQEHTTTRLVRLVEAIKTVYASTYSQRARNYMKYTSYRLEEERMAVVIQNLVGNTYGSRFYPDISGVAKSYNYYSVPPANSDDGLVSVALGLGRTVVEGENSLTFCPKYPKHIQQFSTVEQTLENNQNSFYAIELSHDHEHRIGDDKKYSMKEAEEDGSLQFSASTYSHENRAIYDGISRHGQRIITLSPILKQEIFPLPEIISSFLKLGKEGMGNDIELEFAMRFSKDKEKPHEFCLLQMRPIANKNDNIKITFSEKEKKNSLCFSDRVLGNGHIKNICDIILISRDSFDRSKTTIIADEIMQFNSQLSRKNKPYVLITLGRLGSSDPWLGVPVNWEQIAGVKAIIESGIKEMVIEPSQASHFFQNVSSFKISYFTINPKNEKHFLNWDWLDKQKTISTLRYVRHLRLDSPLSITINGRNNSGLISFK
ncbi:MAG: histidine kinase [Calditrichaeota bacterium]|nr:MAG: histidine kinase [Calditrichota bacterium]MBL1206544.1 histidine kinase [Calditrichota bacterium]NOG46371.1 histidine kinase [Calditrichota bacterium]